MGQIGKDVESGTSLKRCPVKIFLLPAFSYVRIFDTVDIGDKRACSWGHRNNSSSVRVDIFFREPCVGIRKNLNVDFIYLVQTTDQKNSIVLYRETVGLKNPDASLVRSEAALSVPFTKSFGNLATLCVMFLFAFLLRFALLIRSSLADLTPAIARFAICLFVRYVAILNINTLSIL